MPKSELTRRKLLAGLAAAGGAGAGVGTGTSALLTDEVDGLGATLAAGTLDLTVDCISGSCEDEDADAQVATFGVNHGRNKGDRGDKGDGSGGKTKFELRLKGNPGYVWVGIDCSDMSEEDIDFGENLEFTIQLKDDEEGEELNDWGPWSSFSEFNDALSNGILLSPDPDQEYFEVDTPYYLVIEWEKDDSGQHEPRTANSAGGLGYDNGDDDEIDLQLEFEAEQRRNNEPPTDPFEGNCEDEDECIPKRIGKIENTSENHLEKESPHDLNESGDYELEINETRKNGNEITGVAFNVLGDDTDPTLAKVEITGGRNADQDNTVVYDDFAAGSNETEGILTTNEHHIHDGKHYEISNIVVYICEQSGD